MKGARLGRWSGLWLSSVELAAAYVLITEEGESPVTHERLFEGAIVRDKELASVVFEVFLRDEPRGRWFLTPV